MYTEEQLQREAQKYEQFAKNILLQNVQTDTEIAKVLREIEDAQKELEKYQKDFKNLKKQIIEDKTTFETKSNRRTQSFRVTKEDMNENLFSDYKNSLVGSNESGIKSSWISEKGLVSNPSTTYQSMVLMKKSGVSGSNTKKITEETHTDYKNRNTCEGSEFGIAAKVNNLIFLNTSLKNSGISKHNPKNAPITLKTSNTDLLTKDNNIEAKFQTPVFRIHEERLLTFSDSINQIYDPSELMAESQASSEPVSKQPIQRYNSCQKLKSENSGIKAKTRNGVRLPVTFTNLDEILKINPVRSNLRSHLVSRMAKNH